MMKVSKCKVQVGGNDIYYEVVGEGNPLILVHGLSGSTRWWVRNVSALAQHYKIYLVDLPGFGAMRHPRSRFVLAEATSWLLMWMKAVGISQADFVGHSMGGYICLKIAAHHPQVVHCLVLAAPAGVPSRARSIPGYFFPLLFAIRYMTPRFIFILLYDALRAGPLTLIRTAQDLLAQDVREDLERVSVPTLLIWGENDTLVPPTLAQVLHQKIAHSNLLLLKKAGHVVMYDQAQEFNAAVLSFLAEKSGGVYAV